MGKLYGWLKQAASEFSEDECMNSGAALAYYTIFSLPPLLALVFFVAGLFGVSEKQIQRVVNDQLGVPLAQQQDQQAGQQNGQGEQNGQAEPSGQQSSDESQQSSDEGQQSSGEGQQPEQPGTLSKLAGREDTQADFAAGLGPISKAIGIALLVFSATGVFAQLQFALNRAWEVEPDPEQGGVLKFLTKRVLSLGMIVVIVFLLLVSLVLTTLLEEITRVLLGQSPDEMGRVVGLVLNNLVALVMAVLLFAAMFRILPDANMRWRDTWVGAVITAALFILGKSLIGWYLQSSEIGTSWGTAAASLVAMLVWIYYSSLIVLFGAELTQVWARQFGSGIQPAEGAVRKKEEKRHVRGSQE